MLLRLRGTYGHRAADAQRLPHEQLRAGPHEHLLGGAHHHHARGLHSQDSGGFEHGGGFPAKGGGVERLSGVVNWAFRHRNVGEAGARPLPGGPEKAESLIGCGGQCAERGQTIRLRSPTSLRHDCLPPAIAAHPEHTPDAPANMSDNENNDAGGDEMVTKPFKFVTGKLFRAAAFMKSTS
jgi:hypothetical protein